MDAHPITSRYSGNCFASAGAAVSRSLGRLTHEWREPMSDGGHDRSDFEFPGTTVEISPPDAVVRHALNWRGMAAETVTATEPSRVEVRFRAPVHLLILFEEGVRKDGGTCVAGLPRSARKRSQNAPPRRLRR